MSSPRVGLKGAGGGERLQMRSGQPSREQDGAEADEHHAHAVRLRETSSVEIQAKPSKKSTILTMTVVAILERIACNGGTTSWPMEIISPSAAF